MNKTLKEIKAIEKRGDKCLKTGLFNWKKDFAGAASNYDSAATKYKQRGAFENVIYLKD